MTFRTSILAFSLLLTLEIRAQVRLHTEDLSRFYQAFDSVMTTTDTAKQTAIIQQLYVDKASQGLRTFMELRGGTAPKWRVYIAENKEALIKKRPYILSVLNQEAELFRKLIQFKKIYPDFREGDVYFCVGIGNSGGTIRGRTVYIGTEVAASERPNWAIPLVLHEFVHTQQWVQRHINELMGSEKLAEEYGRMHKQLLEQCIGEGMAEFVSELVLGQRLAELSPDGYIAYSLKHEKSVWDAFQKEMYKNYNWNDGWLYNEKAINGTKVRDLGYAVGYQICKSYYDKAHDKKQALNYMIGLNLTDENARNFLRQSGYETKKKADR
ncbi:hypothetical protein [Spirosoma montaniterrae]|uniref:DUF2268 domain-containing protein n=1 Tax=Spirosoma montaniterrae TaxID=1178516 RepID=A0A1P9X3I2_9BACT|nr:hypothetical protein [Spirosoma montaniterrae]AQG82194.1 hypothetical protein AWR27_24605 [Spirosoma montaniterrae]